MKTMKTHFEQIPVETVKKIAQEFPENAIENESTHIEKEPWREVAQKVQEEKDPGRMIALVQELITKLDEEQIGKGLPHSRTSSSGD
jgi:hypothetical protein